MQIASALSFDIPCIYIYTFLALVADLFFSSHLLQILGPDSGWQSMSLTEIITINAVKKAYRKATLYVHPDKLQQRGASIQQKYICEKVFDLLKVREVLYCCFYSCIFCLMILTVSLILSRAGCVEQVQLRRKVIKQDDGSLRFP